MNDKTAYPLCWPESWPRRESYKIQSSKFLRSSSFAARRRSMSEATSELQAELDRLGASRAILSSNVVLRLDGLPRSDQAQPKDKGVAVYFTLKNKPVSLACDKWDRVEDNVWAIVKHIESLRGQDRWGVGSIEQAFRGYMALPAPGQTAGMNWWQVLGVPLNADRQQIREAYLILVKKHHPDAGGDADLFHRVQEAWEMFDRQYPE